MATTGYEYDANGNQLRLVEPQGITAFTYDEENRLIGMGLPTGETVEYQYDGQGQRVRMKDPNVEVHYQYSGGQVISERDGAGAVIAYYVRGLGGRLISNVQTAGARYYHFDGLGSVVALTDSAGAKLVAYTYDEFGVLKQSTGQSWNSFGYTSSIYDATPNLYLMGARYYDPNLGRFITQDTWEGNAWDPWTRNLCAYGRGNPVTFIDPTGHAGVLPDMTYVDCNEVDFELLMLKWEYARTPSDVARVRIAREAELVREAHRGHYTVRAERSLDHYIGIYAKPFPKSNARGLALKVGYSREVKGRQGVFSELTLTLGADSGLYLTTGELAFTSGGWFNASVGLLLNSEDPQSLVGRGHGANQTFRVPKSPVGFHFGTDFSEQLNTDGEQVCLAYVGLNWPPTEATFGGSPYSYTVQIVGTPGFGVGPALNRGE